MIYTPQSQTRHGTRHATTHPVEVPRPDITPEARRRPAGRQYSMIGEAVVRALETETRPDIDTDRINRRLHPNMSAAGTTGWPFFVSSRRRDVCRRMRESVTERRGYQHVVPGEPPRRVTTRATNAVQWQSQQHGCTHLARTVRAHARTPKSLSRTHRASTRSTGPAYVSPRRRRPCLRPRCTLIIITGLSA